MDMIYTSVLDEGTICEPIPAISPTKNKSRVSGSIGINFSRLTKLPENSKPLDKLSKNAVNSASLSQFAEPFSDLATRR